jgi:putative SOS response-associated peptidase YedK
MCGRFSLKADLDELMEAFPDVVFPAELSPRYNIAPSQMVAVVSNNGQNKVEFFRWGLIPAWAKEPSIGNRMINARAETLAEKPAFRAAYRRRRCLVLADGFYEWRAEPGRKGKTPLYIQLASGRPFAFGGLWERWQFGEEALFSCTIVTTEPNALLESIHNRMPLILKPGDYARWLESAEKQPAELSDLLLPYPASEMMAFPVSKLVNDPKNDRAECVAPLG